MKGLTHALHHGNLGRLDENERADGELGSRPGGGAPQGQREETAEEEEAVVEVCLPVVVG